MSENGKIGLFGENCQVSLFCFIPLVRCDEREKTHRLYVAHRLLCAWDSPGTNPGVGCHFLLQGIVPTQGLSLGLLHCRQILYCLSHQGSPVQGPNTVRSPTNESKALPVLSHANTEQGYPVQSKAMPTL